MNRHDRRKANKGNPKVVVRSEVYAMIGKDGRPLHLDVVSMRKWAERHAEQVRVMIDFRYIERLIARGAVTRERVMSHTIFQEPKPVIVCLDINEEGDELVDGNHTYVAAGVAWAKGRELGVPGFDLIEHPWANGFMLTPEQWRPFVIPPSKLGKKAV